jgi:uncharacterized protein YodC (DUF2158 family)
MKEPITGRFRLGDRVRSTDGGPVMQIKEYVAPGQVACSWYETGEGWKRQSFPEHILQRVGRARVYAT